MTRQLAFAIVCLGSTIAVADTMSKEACVDAHSRGQDAKEQGKISLARKLFLSCAQSGCPTAVQGDCARFADDLSSLQPTVNFVARDSTGNDLPNTTVYVDGMLVAAVIDGRPVDIDPGNHTVKFSSGGKEEVVTVVIGSGEKGRVVQARFGGGGSATGTSGTGKSDAGTSGPRVKHPKGALALIIGGTVIGVGGSALAIYGKVQMPSQCSLSSNHCAAAPGDPVFDDASSAARNIDLGIAAASIGLAAVVGGFVWYYAGATKMESPTQAVAPFLHHDGGGIAVSGRF